ncbi:hypothetical protein ScalyP_jg115, partial [Parmales sp. scaly parma]
MGILIGDDEKDRREIGCFAAEISGKTADDGLRKEPIVALSTNLEEVKMSEELINRIQRELREPKSLPRDKAKSIAERKEEFKKSPQGIRDSMQYSHTQSNEGGDYANYLKAWEQAQKEAELLMDKDDSGEDRSDEIEKILEKEKFYVAGKSQMAQEADDKECKEIMSQGTF